MGVLALFQIQHNYDNYENQNPDPVPARDSGTSCWRIGRNRSVANTDARQAGSSPDLAFFEGRVCAPDLKCR